MFHVKHFGGVKHVSEFLLGLDPPLGDAGLITKLESYVETLLKHARRHNLLSVSQQNPESAWSHVLDSLQPLCLWTFRTEGMLLDAGSGGGLPGVPLAIALPDARVVLAERSSSKSEFLELVRALVPLPNVEVRGEELAFAISASTAGAVILARALTQPAKWSQLLRKTGGLNPWVIFATAHNRQEWVDAASASSLALVDTHEYSLPNSPGSRVLLRFDRTQR